MTFGYRQDGHKEDKDPKNAKSRKTFIFHP